MKKAQLAKLKDKMPKPVAAEEPDDMLEFSDVEESESPEHEAAESPAEEASEHETGMKEGTPEEEAAETEEQHTAELSDDALLAEVKKRGLMGKMGSSKKAVAVSPAPKDLESETGY